MKNGRHAGIMDSHVMLGHRKDVETLFAFAENIGSGVERHELFPFAANQLLLSWGRQTLHPDFLWMDRKMHLLW